MDPQPFPLDFDLETTLPYLLNRAGVRIGQSFTGELERHRLSLAEWRLLAALLKREAQTLSELAAHTSLELSRTSRLVGGLEERGLLRRQASGADGRAVELSLTRAGRAAAQQIVPLAQLYERVALSGMTNEEVQVLKRLLVKVYDNMNALHASAPGRARRQSAKAKGR